MVSFLNEVAAELVSRGISEPNEEQIGQAMLARINRQGKLFSRLFGCGYKGQLANGTQEFIAAMAEAVYIELQAL